MTTHCSAETFSAYIDEELTGEETLLVEEHLAGCAACRGELHGFNRAVQHARSLERLEPPSVLGLAVQRRITLDGDRKDLTERLEGRLKNWSFQSNIALAFALVFAFAAILVLFSQAIDRHQRATIPVVFGELPAVEGSDHQDIAGRRLVAESGGWRQEEASGEPQRELVVGSVAWAELIGDEPALEELEALAAPAVVLVGEEVVRILPARIEP